MAESDDTNSLEKAVSEFEKIKDYKDSAERLNECKIKLLNLKKLIKKRSRIIKLVSISAFGTIILLGLLGYFVIYPFIAFQNGNYSVYINMYNVSEFEVPEGTTSIEYWMFEQSESLTSVTIPDSVTRIGDHVFSDCTNITSVTIPDSVTSIGSYAFYSCDKLTSVTIPDSVTSIGYGAFEYCTSLTRVTIPDSVTSIGNSAFRGCTSLESITVDEDNAYYASKDGNLYTKDGKTLVQYAIGKTAPSFKILYGVTSIGEWAFSHCTSLKSVTIPDSVTSISSYAFYNCTSLTSVTISDRVTRIGYVVFENCNNLTVINYQGSEAQWNAILKGSTWDWGAGSYTVNYNYR